MSDFPVLSQKCNRGLFCSFKTLPTLHRCSSHIHAMDGGLGKYMAVLSHKVIWCSLLSHVWMRNSSHLALNSYLFSFPWERTAANKESYQCRGKVNVYGHPDNRKAVISSTKDEKESRKNSFKSISPNPIYHLDVVLTPS